MEFESITIFFEQYSLFAVDIGNGLYFIANDEFANYKYTEAMLQGHYNQTEIIICKN